MMIIPMTFYNLPLLLACMALDGLFFLTTVLIVVKHWRTNTRSRAYVRLEEILEWPMSRAERMLRRLGKGPVPSWLPVVCVLLAYAICRHLLTVLFVGV